MQTMSGAYSRKKLNISLTPLIDVVFILLIFFMLASSFAKEKTVLLEVPDQSSDGVTQKLSSEESWQLTIKGHDKHQLNQDVYSLSQLKERLGEIEDQNLVVIVGADAVAQDLIYVMDLVAILDIENISIRPQGK